MAGLHPGFTPELDLEGENLIYEAYAYFDQALTDEERDSGFGFLAARHPVYVGEWGAPLGEDSASCHSLPRDPAEVSNAVQRLLLYFLIKQVSWTATDFRPGDLIADFENADASVLDREWNCGADAPPVPGIGRLLLFWLTGDLHGFGSIAADQIASAAGGPPGPIAPGQMLSIYGQGLGPDVEVQGALDPSGKLPVLLEETEVRFDGIPAPLFSSGSFQLKVQVPYEVAGKRAVTLQASYRGVRSNTIQLAVADASPEIFVRFATVNEAAAFDASGRANSQGNPFSPGDLMVIFATGLGPTSPAGVTGMAAAEPLPKPSFPAGVAVGGQTAPIEYISQAPGLIGVTQIHARIPEIAPSIVRAVPLSITAGTARSRGDVRIWLR